MAELLGWLASDNGYVVHVAILVLLVLGGLGFPIPEDIPILLGGVAAAKDIVTFQAVFLTCYIGVILGDQIMFFIGYHFGQKLLDASTRSRFLPAVTEEKVHEIREGLRKRRLLYIFIGRHLFPLRSVTFLSAGALRMPILEFLTADALAALVSVLLVLSVGYWLGDTLTREMLSELAHNANFYILLAVILGLIGYLVYRSYRRRSRRKAHLEANANAATPKESVN